MGPIVDDCTSIGASGMYHASHIVRNGFDLIILFQASPQRPLLKELPVPHAELTKDQSITTNSI